MNYLEQLNEIINNFLKDTNQNLSQFLNNLTNEIVQSYEKYKKIGEEDQSEEAQKIRQSFDEFLQNIERFFQSFDLHLTEFFIEAQKSTESLLQQIQTFFDPKNILELQNKISEFTTQIQNQNIDTILNRVQNLFSSYQSKQGQEKQEENLEDISIIFSESDYKKKDSKSP
jgi:predicted transcriptional regulator